MIEDKDLGLKIAENSDEVFWFNLKSKCEIDLKSLKDLLENINKDKEKVEAGIKINSALIEFCNEKLKKK